MCRRRMRVDGNTTYQAAGEIKCGVPHRVYGEMLYSLNTNTQPSGDFETNLFNRLARTLT